MKRIFLTFELNANDACFDDLTDVLKIESGELLDTYSYDPLQHTERQRTDFVVDAIVTCSSDILVGSAAYSFEQLDHIAACLRQHGDPVTTLFIPSVTRLAAVLEAGQEMYRSHNRWLDFYPGQIEEIHESREQQIRRIIDGFAGSATNVVEK